MTKHIYNIFRKTLLIALEGSAILAILVLLIGGIFVWRLTSGPLDIGFAKEYVQEALKDETQGYEVNFANIVLHWPDLDGPLLLSAKNVDIISHEQVVASTEEVAISLAKGPLLIGRIYPKAIILQKPQIKIIRDSEGGFALDLQEPKDNVLAQDAEQETKVIKEMLDILLLSPKEARQKKSPISRLKRFEIAGAQLVVEDHKAGMSWRLPEVSAIFSRTNKGIEIVFDTLIKKGDRPSGVKGKISYDRMGDDFLIDTQIQRLDPVLFSRNLDALSFLKDQDLLLDGNISATFSKAFNLKKAYLFLTSKNGSVSVPDIYEEPLPYKDLALKMSYEDEWKLVELTSFDVTLNDLPLKTTSRVKIGKTVVEGPITIEIADLPLRKIEPLWPDLLKDEPAKKWLTQKLSEGRFYDAQVSFDLKAEKNEQESWQTDVRNLESAFSFEKLKIDYRAPLMPVLNAKGKGTLKEGAINIAVETGAVSDMDLSEGSIVLDDLFVKGAGTADIDLRLAGPLKTVFKYVEREPLSLGKKLDFNVDDVEGDADLKASVDFPTIKDLKEEDLTIKIEATANNVRIPNVVRSMDLTHGPLSVSVEKGKVDVSGKAKLGGRDIDFNWARYINEQGAPFISKVTARLITDSVFRERFGANLDDFVTGILPIDLIYIEPSKNRAEIDLDVDITPAVFFVDPFDYIKPAGKEGKASCHVSLVNDEVKEINNFYMKTNDAMAENGRFVFGRVSGTHDIKRGNFPKVILGENDFSLDFERARKDLLKISIDGRFLDAIPFLEGDDDTTPYDGPALVASAKAQRMRTAKTRMVENAKIYVDLNRKGEINQLELDADAGKGAIYLRYKPDINKDLKFRLEADDAGAFLRAFDVYDNVQGGTITVYGEPIKGGHKNDLSGIVRIENFKVTKAPALARLLSVMSLTGITELLNNKGLGFSKLESRFEYLKKRHGKVLNFENGRTSGSSIGVTFSGTVDKGTDQVDMQGTVAPMSEINTLLRDIPLFGEILTGGEGIIAAKYTMKGKADDPKVSINPLSVLTPGFLRDILFQDDKK